MGGQVPGGRQAGSRGRAGVRLQSMEGVGWWPWADCSHGECWGLGMAGGKERASVRDGLVAGEGCERDCRW